MHVTKRPDRETARCEVEADVGRRRLLLAIVGLPLAAQGAWGLAGCSAEEDASGPEAAGGSPAAPEPAAKPADSAGTAGPAGAEPASGAPAGGAGTKTPPGDALVTEVEAMKATVQALQYVNASIRPDQRCSNCQFYTARTAERGSCQLFALGLVTSAGWCSSWTKRMDA